MPKLNEYDIMLINIYDQCSSSRDGMSGSLNYSVLLDVAKSKGIEDYEDLLYLANEIENELSKKRSNDKK